MHKQVPQFSRVEHVRVVECGERGHRALQPQFLIVGCEFGEHRPAFGVRAPLVGHERFEPNPAVSTDTAILDLAFVEELDQRRTGDVQHVRRLLGGEFGVYGNERHGVSPGHLFKDVDEHSHGGSW